MTWNLAPECISIAFLCTIWVYARSWNPLPTLRNRMFQLCFFTTFCAMASNIAATAMIYNYTVLPLPLIRAVNTIYFIATPLMGLVYFCYTVSVVYSDTKTILRVLIPSFIPAAFYLFLVILNIFNGCIFSINAGSGYVRGPYIVATYIVFYIYCLLCVVISWVGRKGMRPVETRTLLVFPVLAVLVIIIQQLFPTLMLSGSAATCALLFIYLYLENKQISMDYLTGLPNRQVFLDMLELRLSKRKTEPFAVIVLSLRQFKQINKKYGQQNGSSCIQQISIFLKTIVRLNHLYRFSGDEFAILIEDPSKQSAAELINKLRIRMLAPWRVGAYSYTVPAAIGVISYQESLSSIEAIVNGIEYSVSSAKQGPPSCCVYCTEEMIHRANRRDEIVEILKGKIKSNSIEVYFQPILTVASNRFEVAESLARITNSSLGAISPGEFIPIAEDSGLIIPLTYQILNRVCAFIKRMMAENISFSGVSLNLSSVQFADEDFAQKLLNVIDANEVPYSKIKIEITESVLVSNFEAVKSYMYKMHELGFVFGLDDFGTGYSNISSVLTLPWDTIKLDKSLVWQSIYDKKAAIIVNHLASAFSALGIKILAEGVETEIQNTFIIGAGCDMIQGFLYARPTCSDDAVAVFKEQPAQNRRTKSARQQ